MSIRCGGPRGCGGAHEAVDLVRRCQLEGLGTLTVFDQKTPVPPEVREVVAGARSNRFVPDGIYYCEGRVYKVLTSQYGQHHTSARMHDPETGRWEYAKGMMGRLRPQHAMTPEDSRRYEEEWDCAMCCRCGAPLENPDSVERRIGPVCLTK